MDRNYDHTNLGRHKVLGSLAAGTAVLGVAGTAAAQQGDGRNGQGRNGGTGTGGNVGGRNDRSDQSAEAPSPQPFSRMFARESTFAEVDDDLLTTFATLGAPAGVLAAQDPLEEGAIRLITEPAPSANNANNATQTAGSTFMGQFLDHDITRDAGSTLGRAVPLGRSSNLRSARFDLDSVYGGGPEVLRELYEDDDRYVFRVESGGLYEDLPRDGLGQAIIADPAEFGKPDPQDMNGGRRAPWRFIGWQTFFDFGDGEVKPNKRIDTHISTPLFQLPMGSISTSRGELIGPTSLATRNLLRHITWEIPSGQRVVKLMGETPLTSANLEDLTDVAPRLEGAMPLWLYIFARPISPPTAPIWGPWVVELLPRYSLACSRWIQRRSLTSGAGNPRCPRAGERVTSS